MSKKSAPWKRRKLAQMHAEQGGLCWWCEKPAVLLIGHPTVPLVRSRATIDHLRDRSNPTRRQPCVPGERRLVMACWECNNERGNAVGAAINRALAEAAA